MKHLLLIIAFICFGFSSYAQPSNDCGENYLSINQCGVAFSVSQATMASATTDENCDVGGSCPITYTNGTGYENFDCNTGTNYGTGSTGDDFNGSIENSLWWGFTPDESCSYTVSINITNCCCKDKGSSNSAQYQIFDADAPLPGGTIQNYMAYQTGVTGSFSETISVTQGQPVYIMLDGLNGTDCDIDVSIQPTVSCSGCNIVLAEDISGFKVEYKDKKAIILWESEDLNQVNVEKSIDGKNWNILNQAIMATSEFSYKMIDENPVKGYNYYRISVGENSYSKTRVIYHTVKSSPLIKIIDIRGAEVIDVENHKGILIYLYEDGTVEKVFK